MPLPGDEPSSKPFTEILRLTWQKSAAFGLQSKLLRSGFAFNFDVLEELLVTTSLFFNTKQFHLRTTFYQEAYTGKLN
jgi:hypothetical protein